MKNNNNNISRHPMLIDGKDINRRRAPGFLQEKLPDIELSSQQQFLNMLPAFLQDLVAQLPSAYFDLTEQELFDRMFPEGEPSQVHEQLRQACWDEYDRCIRGRCKTLDIARITHGICTMGYFVNRYCQDQLNIVWLINPPVDYTKGLKEILSMGITQFREIMKLPNVDPTTNVPNTKLIDCKFKIIQHVDMRLKGAIVQRIDQRNVNVNYEGGTEAGDAIAHERPVEQLSMTEVDDKLKALEKKSQALSAPARVEVDLMKPPTVMLDAEEETQGIPKPDVARPGKLPK